jgi:hypothetical protein
MLNFEFADYADELDAIARLTTAELVAHLRRKSSGFSRGASKFRGVTRHHQHGRWEARIGRVMGNKCVKIATSYVGFGLPTQWTVLTRARALQVPVSGDLQL